MINKPIGHTREAPSESSGNQTPLATAQIHLKQFEAALSSLDQSDEIGQQWNSRIINDFLRVIALRNLDRAVEARSVMEQAIKYSDEHLQRTLQAPFGDWATDEFGDWFAIKHFRNEADKLLRE